MLKLPLQVLLSLDQFDVASPRIVVGVFGDNMPILFYL